MIKYKQDESKRKQLLQETKTGIIEEMESILKWLSSNDYIINKHLLGEYKDTSPKWLEYKKNRKNYLDRYNELEKKLNSMEE